MTKSGLRVVVPPDRPGVFRCAYSLLGASRIARFVSRHVNWKLDPVLLRVSRGRLSSTLMVRSQVLETTGASTGLRRRNAVIYFHDGTAVFVIASNAGAAANPAWFHNLRVHPDVLLAGQPMRATVIADGVERRRLEALGDRVFPTFATYRREAAAAGRTIPVVRLDPVDATNVEASDASESSPRTNRV